MLLANDEPLFSTQNGKDKASVSKTLPKTRFVLDHHGKTLPLEGSRLGDQTIR